MSDTDYHGDGGDAAPGEDAAGGSGIAKGIPG